jgi:hypothetical protein
LRERRLGFTVSVTIPSFQPDPPTVKRFEGRYKIFTRLIVCIDSAGDFSP